MRVLQQKSSNTTTARLCSHVDSSDAATKWLLKKEHGINLITNTTYTLLKGTHPVKSIKLKKNVRRRRIISKNEKHVISENPLLEHERQRLLFKSIMNTKMGEVQLI